MKKIGPLSRACAVHSNSYCGTADLHCLDWGSWFQDNSVPEHGIYIHVRRYRYDEGETWHRVIPKNIKGRICRRLSMRDGHLTWLYDKVKTKQTK